VFVVLAVLAGVSLAGLFQGSNENVANGLIAFHTFGAQGVMPAGNGMAIVVGANGSRIGLDRGRSSASVVLGILGLAMFPVFIADVFTGWVWNIGIFQRGGRPERESRRSMAGDDEGWWGMDDAWECGGFVGVA